MAKEKMVTRTFTLTTATIAVLNLGTMTAGEVTHTINGKYDNDSDLLVAMKKVWETDTEKLVAITSTTTFDQLYGMTENEFLAFAKPLPPRGTSEN